jgi:hypothetical protein
MQDANQEKIYQAAICFIIQTEREIARKFLQTLTNDSLEADNSDVYYGLEPVHRDQVHNSDTRNTTTSAEPVKTSHHQKSVEHPVYYPDLGIQRVQAGSDQEHNRRTAWRIPCQKRDALHGTGRQ